MVGHQEDKKRKLNLYERLNVECDLRSKAFRRKNEEGAIRHRPKSFGFEQWHVTLFGIRVSYDMKSSIKDHTLGTKIVNKMIERKEVSRQAVSLID